MRQAIGKGLLAMIPILVQLCGPSAHAQDADSLLQEGIVTFRLGQFSKSIKALKRAKRKARGGRTVAKINLYLGLNYAVRKDRKRAVKAFRRALKGNPILEASGIISKKSVVALFQRVRGKLKGRLRVTAGRPGVAVSLNGKPVGQAPYDGEIHVGLHKVVLQTADGLYHKRAEVVVWSGREHELKGPLKFIGGRLTLTSTPPGARVLIDGEDAGVTPQKELLLKAGEHHLQLLLKGHRAHKGQVTLRSGETENVSITLSRDLPPAKAPVATAPATLPVAPPTPVDDLPPEPHGGRRWPVWTLVTASVAVAALGVSLGVGLAYKSAIDEYESTKVPARYDELQDQIRQLEMGTNVSFAVAGAATIATALVYLLVDRPAMARHRARVSVGPSGAALSWEF